MPHLAEEYLHHPSVSQIALGQIIVQLLTKLEDYVSGGCWIWQYKLVWFEAEPSESPLPTRDSMASGTDIGTTVHPAPPSRNARWPASQVLRELRTPPYSNFPRTSGNMVSPQMYAWINSTTFISH
jgi:hypothetical protein